MAHQVAKVAGITYYVLKPFKFKGTTYAKGDPITLTDHDRPDMLVRTRYVYATVTTGAVPRALFKFVVKRSAAFKELNMTEPA